MEIFLYIGILSILLILIYIAIANSITTNINKHVDEKLKELKDDLNDTIEIEINHLIEMQRIQSMGQSFERELLDLLESSDNKE